MKILHIKSVNIISNNGEDSNSIDNLKQFNALNHDTKLLSISGISGFELTIKLLKKFNSRYTNVEIFGKIISCKIGELNTDFIFVEENDDIKSLIEEYLNQFSPDIVFTNFMDLRIIDLLQKINMKYIAFVSDNTFPAIQEKLEPKEIEIISKIKYLSTQSEFSKNKLLKSWNKDSFLLYPTVDPELYRVNNSSKEFITLINPVYVKGVDLFVEIAGKMPEHIFVGVGGWTENDAKLFKGRCKNYTNLKYIDETSDMKKIYSRTKILLVPSLWEEAFGRVCMEAMISGIPVITSKNGGLPETLPLPQLNLDTDNPDNWIRIIRKLNNKDYYDEISKKITELSSIYINKQKKTFIEFEKFLISEHI